MHFLPMENHILTLELSLVYIYISLLHNPSLRSYNRKFEDCLDLNKDYIEKRDNSRDSLNLIKSF